MEKNVQGNRITIPLFAHKNTATFALNKEIYGFYHSHIYLKCLKSGRDQIIIPVN